MGEISDQERATVQDLDHLFEIHKKERSDQRIEMVDPVKQGRKKLLESIPGVIEVVLLDDTDRAYIRKHESAENEGVFKVIDMPTVFALTHDGSFRDPDGPIVLKRPDGTPYFPVVGFHELGARAISGSPGMRIHAYLVPKFQTITIEYATVLVGVPDEG